MGVVGEGEEGESYVFSVEEEDTDAMMCCGTVEERSQRMDKHFIWKCLCLAEFEQMFYFCHVVLLCRMVCS